MTQEIRDVILFGFLIAGFLLYHWNEAETRNVYTRMTQELEHVKDVSSELAVKRFFDGEECLTMQMWYSGTESKVIYQCKEKHEAH